MDDLISRQAAIDATWEEPNYTDPINVLTEVRDRIKELPSAQPNLQQACNQLATNTKPKTGKWIYCEDDDAQYVDGYRCDQCGFFVPWDYKHKSPYFIEEYHYCPNCGADMKEELNG